MFKTAIPGHCILYFRLLFSIQLTVKVQSIILPMTGFELRTSGVGRDRSTNWATTPAQHYICHFIMCCGFKTSDTTFCAAAACRVQCDQIGQFLNILGDKFSNKSSPKSKQLFGLFVITSLLCKNYCGYFLGNFWKHLGYILLQHLVTLVILTLTRTWLGHCRLLTSPDKKLSQNTFIKGPLRRRECHSGKAVKDLNLNAASFHYDVKSRLVKQ